MEEVTFGLCRIFWTGQGPFGCATPGDKDRSGWLGETTRSLSTDARGKSVGVSVCTLPAARIQIPAEPDCTRCMNSIRVAGSSWNWPNTLEVVMNEFCFSTPRIIMHM